jgi:hypothetical protein
MVLAFFDNYYYSHVFLNNGCVHYLTSDPAIAVVDTQGKHAGAYLSLITRIMVLFRSPRAVCIMPILRRMMKIRWFDL